MSHGIHRVDAGLARGVGVLGIAGSVAVGLGCGGGEGTLVEQSGSFQVSEAAPERRIGLTLGIRGASPGLVDTTLSVTVDPEVVDSDAEVEVGLWNGDDVVAGPVTMSDPGTATLSIADPFSCNADPCQGEVTLWFQQLGTGVMDGGWSARLSGPAFEGFVLTLTAQEL